jgi:hypothetical protein
MLLVPPTHWYLYMNLHSTTYKRRLLNAPINTETLKLILTQAPFTQEHIQTSRCILFKKYNSMYSHWNLALKD